MSVSVRFLVAEKRGPGRTGEFATHGLADTTRGTENSDGAVVGGRGGEETGASDLGGGAKSLTSEHFGYDG